MTDTHAAETAAKATLAVIGTGIMGRGILQLAAQAGTAVIAYDAREGAAADAVVFVGGMFGRAVEKGRMTQEEADAAVGRIRLATNLHELGQADIIVEAIVERLDAKQELFRQLETVVPKTAILATNTSSLSVTAVAAACREPQRVAGLHFFNPVPLMRVVEIIGGPRTDPAVVDTLVALVERFGHHPVRVSDTPGFLVNHAGRGLNTEGVRIIQEGIATFADVDRVMRDCAGFRMGPFELMDLTGLDVSHPVMEQVYDQYYQEPMYRPSPITERRFTAGLLGRKVGKGFYRYADGAKQDREEAPGQAPVSDLPPVWISGAHPRGHRAAAELARQIGLVLDEADRPGEASLAVVTPLGADATTTALREGLDPKRTVALDTLFSLDRRRCLMTTPVTTTEMRAAAAAAFGRDGVPVTLIHDSPGFIAQRIVATIVNIACQIAQQRIAAPADIDAGVRLGLGYPAGPLAMGDTLGGDVVLKVLEEMHAFYGDPRYRPSPWLKRRALLGVPLLTPEH